MRGHDGSCTTFPVPNGVDEPFRSTRLNVNINAMKVANMRSIAYRLTCWTKSKVQADMRGHYCPRAAFSVMKGAGELVRLTQWNVNIDTMQVVKHQDKIIMNSNTATPTCVLRLHSEATGSLSESSCVVSVDWLSPALVAVARGRSALAPGVPDDTRS